MKVFTDGTLTVVAADLSDAQRVVEAHHGATFEQEGWTLDDWAEVPHDESITIRTEDDDGPQGFSTTKTASEWAASDGRGFLCSTEY